jgi:uroporphyrinogen-III synthase
MSDKLHGRRILILETREEAQFSRLLKEQGADVVQCPMFVINDSPDAAAVEAWIKRLIERPFDDLVLMTGEGLRRIAKVARRMGVEPAFISALRSVRKFARGPKPVRALRELGLEAEVVAEKPTSEGIAETLAKLDLKRHRLGIQLYPEQDHGKLLSAIAAMGAQIDPVLPYVYDAKAAEPNIMAAIDEVAAGKIDAIALTSRGQARRLIETAKSGGLEAKLKAALKRTKVAAVGPVVSDELKLFGIATDIYPDGDAFFMRPLIQAMIQAFATMPPRAA